MTIHLKIGLQKKFQDFKHAFNYMEKISENLEFICLRKAWKRFRNFTDVGSTQDATKNGKSKIKQLKKRGARLRLRINYFIDLH
jgi:hypothetical protein